MVWMRWGDSSRRALTPFFCNYVLFVSPGHQNVMPGCTVLFPVVSQLCLFYNTPHDTLLLYCKVLFEYTCGEMFSFMPLRFVCWPLFNTPFSKYTSFPFLFSFVCIGETSKMGRNGRFVYKSPASSSSSRSHVLFLVIHSHLFFTFNSNWHTNTDTPSHRKPWTQVLLTPQHLSCKPPRTVQKSQQQYGICLHISVIPANSIPLPNLHSTRTKARTSLSRLVISTTTPLGSLLGHPSYTRSLVVCSHLLCRPTIPISLTCRPICFPGLII